MDNQSRIDPTTLRVPVKDNQTGETKYEAFNESGKQSDGSQYFIPHLMVDKNHEHYFKKEHSSSRQVKCDCGFGGDIFPHNAHFINGKVSKKEQFV